MCAVAQEINSLSIFFLAMNDSQTIRHLVERANEVALEHVPDFEIIVSNDASVDATKEVLDQLADEIPNLRVFHQDVNLGYGGNLQFGLSKATKEWIFYTDGDGQYDPEEIPLLLTRVRPEVGVVNGYKKSRSDNFIRRSLGPIYQYGTKMIFALPIRDTDCDFRLIRKRDLDKISLSFSSGAVCPELVAKLHRGGSKFIEVGVSHYPRISGRSQFVTWRRIMETLRDDYLLYKELYPRKGERITYIGVGILAVGVQFILFNIFLTITTLHPAVLVFIADELAIVFAFVLHHQFTFNLRERSQTLHKVIRYHLVTLSGTLMQSGVVFCLTTALGITTFKVNIYMIIGLVIGGTWNFILNSYLVWPHPNVKHQLVVNEVE